MGLRFLAYIMGAFKFGLYGIKVHRYGKGKVGSTIFGLPLHQKFKSLSSVCVLLNPGKMGLWSLGSSPVSFGRGANYRFLSYALLVDMYNVLLLGSLVLAQFSVF